MEATWMEETLDSVGARNSEEWFPFREGVSAIKLFSTVTYDVLHVSNSFVNYQLIKSDNNFESDILRVKEDLYDAIVKASSYLVKRAKKCGIHSKGVESIDPQEFSDIDFMVKLERDRRLRHIDNPGKSLIYLATEFLNLKPELSLFHDLSNLKKADYRNFIPESVSEEKLRLVLVRFHNLQSLYDTYLSESDIESADSRLKVLRGHISFIFHMLKSATDFSHYYERHIVPRKTSIFFSSLLPIPVDRFLEITISFFMVYLIEYFDGAEKLCRDVINSYAEIGEVTVSIPPYRGFHVRPSSLVSKIINYYGGEVRMFVNNVEYDPSTPLELFRVNEEINALKRKKLFEYVYSNGLEGLELKSLIETLAKQDLVVIYSDDFELNGIGNNDSAQDYLKNSISFLLASGKIDIKMDIKVKFIGDKRSLNDIQLLSENGYGEDKYGNNIPLPKKLFYFRR